MESLLQNICRLCANEKPKVSVNMFSDIGKRHQLPDKIRLCLPVSIDEDDRLPKEICVTCLNKLDVCNELYHTSFSAQNILKSKLECFLSDQKQSKKDFSQSMSGNQLNNDNTKLNPKQPASNVTSLGTKLDLIPTKEQLNSSVISTDVVIRLTSLEPQNVNPPKVINFFSPTKEVEVESQIRGIVVTDITGVPLGPLPNDDDDDDDQNMFEADCFNHLSDNEETDNPPDSSERLSSSISESKDDKKNDVHKRKHSQHKTNESKLQKLSADRNEVNVSKVKSASNRGKESSSGMVKCKYCAKKFLKTIIDHHERLHLKERVYSCVDCGKDFCTEVGLSAHNCGKS